ncbi:MAG: hypothetical protein FWC97_02260 [Treponema sp.]|nr:hypothetical protein [Treponema sp.]
MNLLFIVSIVSFALCLIMFFYLHWLIRKRTKGSTLDERRDEFIRLIAEIDRVTDRDSQIVEDRIMKLNEVIEDADKRIAVYVKELEKSKGSEALYTSLGKGIRDALYVPQGIPESTSPGGINTPQNYPTDTIEISSRLSTIPRENAPPPPSQLSLIEAQFETDTSQKVTSKKTPPIEPAEPLLAAKPPPLSKKQIRSHIDLLLNEGLPPQEIASRLGISIGEVQLAINLRR